MSVYRFEYENQDQLPKRITVNGNVVAQRIPPGEKRSVPMQPGDHVVIWNLPADGEPVEEAVGAVVDQARGVFLALRPAGAPDAAPRYHRLHTRRRLL